MRKIMLWPGANWSSLFLKIDQPVSCHPMCNYTITINNGHKRSFSSHKIIIAFVIFSQLYRLINWTESESFLTKENCLRLFQQAKKTDISL